MIILSKRSRRDILKLMKNLGCNDAQIDHGVSVTNLAFKIADEMIKDGKRVDKDIIEAGGLLHDIGILKCKGKLFLLQGYPIQIQLPEDIIIHVAAGGKIATELGFPESVVRVVLRHDLLTPTYMLTQDEFAQLGVKPLSEEECIPETCEEKAVMYSDFWAFMMRLGLDPWGDPDAPFKAAFPYVDYTLKKRTGSGATKGHPIIERAMAFNSELKKFAKPEFLKT